MKLLPPLKEKVLHLKRKKTPIAWQKPTRPSPTSKYKKLKFDKKALVIRAFFIADYKNQSKIIN
jgi:hypothetical protein